MRHKLLLPFLLFCGLLSQLAAQQQASIYVPDSLVFEGTSQVCMPVIADSFPDIAAMQFSLVWDADFLTFSSLDLGDNPLDISPATTFTPTDSTFGVSWLASEQPGYTLASGTTILSICFDLTPTLGTSIISFDSYLTPEFAQNGTSTQLPYTATDGSLTLAAIPPDPLLVLPGDANMDSLVNADDLLNIGLGFGFSGPARPSTSTEFIEQFVSPWTTMTPISLVNYAHADTDGNGLIESADQTVLEANYGESLLNVWEPPVTFNQGQANSFIFLTSDAGLVGGQAGTIDVILGSEALPVEVGHGLSFSLQFSPDEFDLSSFSVDFTDNFLGENVLTFAEFYPNELGLLEIAITRTDRQNSVLPGGKICSIRLTPAITPSNFEADILTTPYRYIDAGENMAVLSQSINRTLVQSPTSITEPAWATELNIAPNPVMNGRLHLRTPGLAFDRIQLISSNGQAIREFSSSLNSLDVSGLPSGVYFLRLTLENESVVRKLILR